MADITEDQRKAINAAKRADGTIITAIEAFEGQDDLMPFLRTAAEEGVSITFSGGTQAMADDKAEQAAAKEAEAKKAEAEATDEDHQ